MRLKYLPQAGRRVEEATACSDGVEELLPRLVDEGYLLGLTTGGTDSAAHIKLARAESRRWFTFGGYGSDSTDRTELTRQSDRARRLLLGMKSRPATGTSWSGDTRWTSPRRTVAGAIGVGVAAAISAPRQLEHRARMFDFESWRAASWCCGDGLLMPVATPDQLREADRRRPGRLCMPTRRSTSPPRRL